MMIVYSVGGNGSSHGSSSSSSHTEQTQEEEEGLVLPRWVREAGKTEHEEGEAREAGTLGVIS